MKKFTTYVKVLVQYFFFAFPIPFLFFLFLHTRAPFCKNQLVTLAKSTSSQGQLFFGGGGGRGKGEEGRGSWKKMSP